MDIIMDVITITDTLWYYFNHKNDLNTLLYQAFLSDKREIARKTIQTECPILYELISMKKSLKLFKKNPKYLLNFKSLKVYEYTGPNVAYRIADIRINNNKSRNGRLYLYGISDTRLNWTCSIVKEQNKFIISMKVDGKRYVDQFIIKTI